MPLLQKAVLKVSTDLKKLDQVLSWFEQLHQDHIPKKDWLQCQLALAEGFTNAVNHAHQNLLGEEKITISVTIHTHSLEIRVWDQGPWFDLAAYINNLDLAETNEFGSGRGIPILLKISDHLDYVQTDDGHNCLVILKYFSAEEKW